MWGELLPIDGTTQVTRSMLEMLNPKLCQNKETNKIEIEEPPAHTSSLKKCSHVTHSIQLLHYIKEIEENIADENGPRSTKNRVLPKIPEAKNPLCALRPNYPFAASDWTNKEQLINLKTSKALTRQGVATLALHYDWEHTTESTLRYLTDLVMKRIENMCQSLRKILDDEAITGYTGFYDSANQLLNEYGINDVSSLLRAYQSDVIQCNSTLLKKSKHLENHLAKVGRLKKHVTPYQRETVVKQEQTSQSGWVSVQHSGGQSVCSVIGSGNWQTFAKTEDSIQPQATWTPSPAQNEVIRAQELSSYMNTFRPISPSQEGNSYRPQKKKFRN